MHLSRHYLAGMLKKKLGPDHFYFERVRSADSSGDGALRNDEDGAGGDCARDRRVGGGNRVTVNSVLAGPTESEGVAVFVETLAKQQNKTKAEFEKEFFEHARPSSLLKRFATVDEVAALVTYLAGEQSSATNGAAVRADGGVVRAIL